MHSSVFALVLSITTVSAWGAEGHRMVGSIAQHFLNDNAKALLKTILPQYNGDITNATNWADEIKKVPEWKWAYNYHFIDTHDTPSKNCSLVEDRDCADGLCIVGAIANYTTQARCENGVVNPNQEVAIKFLTHFAGDIGQPLHACGRERGGNEKKRILFDGQREIGGYNTTLHGFWDYTIIQKDLKLNFENNEEKMVGTLIKGIEANPMLAKSWISKRDVTDKSKYGNSLVAIDWATDSNGFNCELVWNEFERDIEQDFGGSYYENAVPIIHLQLSKSGYRLADMLNRILETCAPLKSTSTISSTPTTGVYYRPPPNANNKTTEKYGHVSSSSHALSGLLLSIVALVFCLF